MIGQNGHLLPLGGQEQLCFDRIESLPVRCVINTVDNGDLCVAAQQNAGAFGPGDVQAAVDFLGIQRFLEIGYKFADFELHMLVILCMAHQRLVAVPQFV
ncbi:hypothetical protein D3C86_1976760 [compost metagenome]